MDASRLAARLNLVGPWLRRAFGGPVVKIGLDAGLGCPNRDASLGGGCAWCPPGGAGSGRGGPVKEQLQQGMARLRQRAARYQRPLPLVLAYFQAYSSTHGPVSVLEPLFMAAAEHPGVAGMIISTRPDCLDGPRWELLQALARRRPLWLELGLQSAHDETLAAMGRGHTVAAFDDAAAQAKERGIRVVAHVILGLPGEGLEHTNATARHLAGLGVWGVKLHNLMVLEGSRLAGEYQAGRLDTWGIRESAQAAAHFLARLPVQTLVHRLAADPGPDRLLAPDWANDKDAVLTAIAGQMEAEGLRQGDLA